MSFLFFLLQETSQQSSNYTNVILNGIFVLLAVIITMGINWLINYRSYKNEYYKKIIDKRLNSYEMLESVMTRMDAFVEYNNSYYFDFCSSSEKLNEISQNISDLTKDLYLSEEILRKLANLSVFININLSYPVINNKENLIEVAIKHYKELLSHFREISMVLYNDLSKLYDVKEFIKSKYERSKILKEKSK